MNIKNVASIIVLSIIVLSCSPSSDEIYFNQLIDLNKYYEDYYDDLNDKYMLEIMGTVQGTGLRKQDLIELEKAYNLYLQNDSSFCSTTSINKLKATTPKNLIDSLKNNCNDKILIKYIKSQCLLESLYKVSFCSLHFTNQIHLFRSLSSPDKYKLGFIDKVFFETSNSAFCDSLDFYKSRFKTKWINIDTKKVSYE